MRLTTEQYGDFKTRLGVGGAKSAAGEATSWLDGVQTSLDVGGLAPGVGIFADGANTLISLARGNFVSAGFNAMAMIPIIRQGTKGAQLGGKVLKAANKGADFAGPVVTKVLEPAVTNSKLKNLVDNLYKGAKGPNPIGTGSTADAVRNQQFPPTVLLKIDRPPANPLRQPQTSTA